MSQDQSQPTDPGGTTPLELPELNAAGDPPADSKPRRRRPTTRAGRAAAAAERKGQREAGPPKPDKPPRTSGRPKTTSGEVALAVGGLHDMIGLGLAMAGRQQTGAVLMDPKVKSEAGEAWAAAARRYPWLERVFGTSTDGLVLVRLAMVYYPIVQIAQHEGADRKAAKAAGRDDVPSGPSADELAAMLGVTPADLAGGMAAAAGAASS